MIKLEWTKEHMRVLNRIGELFKRDKVFSGIKIGLCLHLEAKTACLAMTLHDAGAKVAIAGSNPLSTKDYVASELSKNGVEVFAKHGESMEEYYENINKVLDIQPNIIIDDGADMSVIAHKRGGLNIRGCAEETTTGVKRLRALRKKRLFAFSRNRRQWCQLQASL
jgi:S-adenosylhomocysteine hydrolase